MTETPPVTHAINELWAEAHVYMRLDDAPLSKTTSYDFRPMRLSVTLGWNPDQRSWGLTDLAISGPRVKSDGTNGGQRGRRDWWELGSQPDPYADIAAGHEWLVPLVQEAVTYALEHMTPVPSVVDQRAAVVNT